MENITIAIISGLCVALSSIIATLSSNKSSIKLIDHKINELTNHVNKHNNLIPIQNILIGMIHHENIKCRY